MFVMHGYSTLRTYALPVPHITRRRRHHAIQVGGCFIDSCGLNEQLWAVQQARDADLVFLFKRGGGSEGPL